MPKATSPSRGQFFFLLILLLAAGLRFVHLGSAPLSEFEAGAALAAKAVAQGQPTDLGAQPGYVLLTSLLFRLLGTGNALARLWPAVAGLALVALPYYWRKTLGQTVALVLSLFLALDPGLVALARLAGGSSLSLAAGLWAASLLLRGRAVVLAGALAAAALLAGPGVYLGLAAAALTWRLERTKLPSPPWQAALPAFFATLVLGGTLLFSAPQGLSGLGQGLAAFLLGHGYPAGVSIGEMLFALFGYGLPALLLGLPHLLRAEPAPGTRPAAIFAGLALLLGLLHPGRQVAHLAWVLLPLYWLAAAEVSRYLRRPQEEPRATYGEFALISLLMPFFAFTLARASGEDYLLYFEPGRLMPVVNPQVLLPLVVVLIAGAASLLVALGWSPRAARQGLVWALSLAACLGLLAASARYGRQTAALTHDLWQPGAATANLRPLLESVDDLSFWGASQPGALAIQRRSPSAALDWALREYPAASGQAAPALAITPADQLPVEFAAYRGQSFAWQTRRDWDAWPPNIFAWLLFRQGSQTDQHIILWARTDLFADGDASLQNFDEAIP